MADSQLRYGMYLPPFGPFGDPAVLVGLAERAEAAGWDGVFLWDHLVYEGRPIADPWTTLAAMAQATSRVRLGPMVTPVPRRRPWMVARHAAAVSRLSGGRLIFGAGQGSDESGDFSRIGSSAKHPKVMARVAACDGIFPNSGGRTLTPDELAGTLAAVRLAGPPSGRAFDVAIPGNASPAWPEPPTVDLDGLAQAGMTWWMESLIHFDPLELSLEIVDAGPPR